MKSSKLILALWLGASAWAQTLPQKQQASSPVTATPNAAQRSSSSAPSTKMQTPAMTGAAAPLAASQKLQVRQEIAKQVAPPTRPATVQLSNPVATSSARVAGNSTRRSPSGSVPKRYVGGKKAGRPASAAEKSLGHGEPAPTAKNGRRDPFVSQVVERTRNGGSCAGSGKQCLVVGELSLHGVVRSPSGYIAVVMNGERTYFLREHDPLADGAVERITNDAIILRERSSDALGRPLTRQVTKKLGVPAV